MVRRVALAEGGGKAGGCASSEGETTAGRGVIPFGEPFGATWFEKWPHGASSQVMVLSFFINPIGASCGERVNRTDSEVVGREDVIWHVGEVMHAGVRRVGGGVRERVGQL